MKIFDLPEPIRNALCTFEALRRLGFESDDIFFLTYQNSGHFDVELRTQDKEFRVNCGVCEGLIGADVRELWMQTDARIKNGTYPSTDCARMYQQSAFILGRSLDFISAILGKGITLPVKTPFAAMTSELRN